MSEGTSDKATAWRNAHPAWRPKVCNSAGHGNVGITGHDTVSHVLTDTLHIRLCGQCDIALPLVSAPPHMLALCLFVCLFTFIPQHHMPLALFAYFPFWIVSIVDRQWADVKSDCTHCIRGPWQKIEK